MVRGVAAAVVGSVSGRGGGSASGPQAAATAATAAAGAASMRELRSAPSAVLHATRKTLSPSREQLSSLRLHAGQNVIK
jgi:hypothetical protein